MIPQGRRVRMSLALVAAIVLAGLITAGHARVHETTDRSQAAAATTPAAQPSASASRLVPGSPIGERTQVHWTHVYNVDIHAGDFVDVRLSQDEVLARLTLRDPRGAVSAAVTMPSSDPLPARLLLVAEVTGMHQLEVFVNGLDEERGVDHVFTIEILALHPATDDDRELARIAALRDRAAALAMQQRLASLEQSIPLFLEAANGWHALGERHLEAATLKSLAHVTSLFTQFRATSADAFRRLISVLREIGDSHEESDAWYRLAIEHDDDGQLARARDAAMEAARLSRRFPDQAIYSRHSSYAAFVELQLGNYDEARRLAGEALDAAIVSGGAALESEALTVLAQLQYLAGDIDAAIAQQERALVALQQPLQRRGRLTQLGFFYLRAGQFDEAEKRFTESLALGSRAVNFDHETKTRLGLGDIAAARGDRERARALYEEARSRLLRSGHLSYRCGADTRIGRLMAADGDVDQARQLFENALTIAREISSPTCEAASRTGLADLAIAAGRLEEGQSQTLRLVELHDDFREASTRVEARTLGFAALAPAYERAVDVTMQMARGEARASRVAEALALNERGLARGLLDALTAERVERAHVPSGLDAERLRVREAWRARVIEHETAIQRGSTSRAAALAEEITSLATRLRDIEARIDAADPRRAAFTRPPGLRVADIQALLDEDTLLIEYGLGETRSYAWVVGAAGVSAFTLAPRALIETAARRVHAGLATLPDGRLTPALDARRRADLKEMARLVLEPLAPLLTKRRLVIVAPGALALVPFGALPVGPHVEGVARHEIVFLPSATVLAAFRAIDATRPAVSNAVAVFADPVYERDDPRVTARLSQAAPSTTGAASGGWSRGGGVSLARLPFSGREAAAIRRYAPSAPLTIVGLSATRERAMAPDLATYRILHFAAHGVLHADVPNLSGIALSLIDARGRPRNGFLMLPDIYELTLNAELVVLSSCETFLGKEIRGEGQIGVSRGFMYAGAARVVSSLWRVDDEATAALMDAFYRRVLRDNVAPAAALRAAQLEIRGTPRWRAPFYWAGFTLQGDWR